MSIEDVLKNLEKEDDDNADMADVLTDTQKNLETAHATGPRKPARPPAPGLGRRHHH
jgi:hypothetical protein